MGSDCGVPGLFSSSFPHSNYSKPGPNYFRSMLQTFRPHIFTFDNDLFKRCFLFYMYRLKLIIKLPVLELFYEILKISPDLQLVLHLRYFFFTNLEPVQIVVI